RPFRIYPNYILFWNGFQVKTAFFAESLTMEDRKQPMLQVFFEEDESMKRKLLAIILAALALCMLGGFTLGGRGARSIPAGMQLSADA
ncbi:hypothetical protein DW086_13640, partial [Harryflintia acetispora]